MAQTFNSNFIGDFNLGDNIQYNLGSLNLLYKQYLREKDDEFGAPEHLTKPLLIVIMSITEALIYDLFERSIRIRTREGVNGINEDVLEEIRQSTLDKFNLHIEHSEKHSLFNVEGLNFYEKIRELKNLRNRVHIQNKFNYGPRKDLATFTEAKLTDAEIILEITLRVLSTRHQRPGDMHNQTFELPWDEHEEVYQLI